MNEEKANTVPDTKKSSLSKRKKRAIIFVFVILALLIILPIISFIDWNSLSNKKNTDEDSWITFYGDQHFVAVDYDENIEEDTVYMSKDRRLHYSENNETFSVDSDPSRYGLACELFYKYFELVKAGDHENYYSLFTKEYAEKHGDINFFTKNKLIFTQQKIYNINVKLIRSSYLENGDANGKYVGSTVYYFDVSYRIKDNNGTFRRDMRSDEAVPLVFELLETDGIIKISNISFYKPQIFTKSFIAFYPSIF